MLPVVADQSHRDLAPELVMNLRASTFILSYKVVSSTSSALTSRIQHVHGETCMSGLTQIEGIVVFSCDALLSSQENTRR